MVHRRELGGEPVVFGNQGDLWNNAMTWFDHDTGSIWSQVTGEALMGPLRGETLELLPSTLTTWTDWQERFPETLALDKFTRETRFELDQTAVVTVIEDDSLAVPVPVLRDVGLVNEVVGGEPVVIVIEPGSDRWNVMSRQLGERVVELQLADGALLDPATGDRWDAIRGVPLPGNRSDALDRLPSFSSFPFDYARIYPDGRVWTDAAVLPSAALTDSRSPTG